MSQKYNDSLKITPQEYAHFDFVERTEKKNLYTNIKNLVCIAQEFSQEDLTRRRKKLHDLLEYEDKIYEDEFASKVKLRIDEDIQKRKNILYDIKEESMRNAEKFLQRKRIQQNMESCYEIREMLRKKETQNVKQTHLEQMLEKERSIARERQLDKYWQNVNKVTAQKQHEVQCQEERLKRELAINNRRVLEIQLQEHADSCQKERQQKAEEAAKINAIMQEMRLEEFDRKANVKSAKVLAYRQDLLNMIAERQTRLCAERHEAAEAHRELMRAIAAAEEEERVKNNQRKRDTYKALVEFVQYVRRMRALEEQQRRMRDDRTDDLRRVDICTKQNLTAEAKRRAEVAHACYCDLRKQICEEAERRLREEAERRENKILQNLFVHEEVPWAKVIEQRNKYRQELDEQIATLKLIRAEENKHLHEQLLHASNDPQVCEELAAQYLKEGTDYLEPHANWRILLCPQKTAYAVDLPAQKKEGGGDGQDKCPECFGCEGKHKFKCQFAP